MRLGGRAAAAAVTRTGVAMMLVTIASCAGTAPSRRDDGAAVPPTASTSPDAAVSPSRAAGSEITPSPRLTSPEAAAPATRPPDTCGTLEVAVPEVPADDLPVPDLVDARHLASFYERAAAVIRGRAKDHVRIAVYGDSNLTMDFLTGQMRRTLQQTYGDAGHGYVALTRPWSHYQHMDVRHDAGSGWRSIACSTDPVMDRLYGIACIAAESMSLRARTWVETATSDAPIGQRASHFDFFFLRGPGRGAVTVEADGRVVATPAGEAPETGLGHAHFELPDGPHRVEVVATDAKRRARVFGLALERRGRPSFVVDAFGVGSLNTESQARADAALNRAMLRARRYDLVVFATGANDVFTLDVTPGHLAELIANHRRVLPDAPILILTPADRGKDKPLRQTLDAIEQRKAIAREHDAALWDLFTAMGGAGSMRAFYRRGLAMADHIHFNREGGTYMGLRFTHALWRGLRGYVDAHPRAGCGPKAERAHVVGGDDDASG